MKRQRQIRNKISDRLMGGSDLVIDTSQITARNRQNPWLLSGIAILSVFSSYMGFCDGFDLNVSLFLVLFITMVFSILTQLVLTDTRRMKVGLPALGIGIVAYMILTSAWLVNGFTLITNQLITYVNEHKAEAHLKFVASDKTPQLDMALATIAICAIYAVLFGILLRYRRIFLCAILLLGSSMANMYFNGEDQMLWVALALICTFVVFYVSNIRIAGLNKSIHFGSGLFVALAVVSTVFVVFVRYAGIRSVDDLKDEIVYRTGNVIYGKSDYPEGQFKRFDEVPAASDKVRLTVSMSNPVPLHLKGYVGCQYTEKGWKGNDEEIYGGDNRGMIEWFLEQGYYPLTQTAYYMGYSRNDGRDIDFHKVGNSSIHIVNDSASKKYEYVPENLLDMSGLIDPKQDVNFVEQDIFSEKEYWYDILYFTKDDYLKFPSQSWFENKDAGTQEQQFIQAENYYHGFASTYYLAVPEEETAILQQNIPACSNNVSDAISTVRRYLKSQMVYSENCEDYVPGENYLRQILLEDQRGYSVHFATVATLMFRYYGVPARYVEGYLSLNEDEKDTVELKNSDAHAWVEVYIKGLGFVPVEVTPGFYQEEETGGDVIHKKQEQQNPGGGGGSSGDEDENNGESRQITWQMVVGVILIFLLLCLVLFLLVLVIRRAILVSRRNKALASADDYLVVATASRYMEQVYAFAGNRMQEEIPSPVREILERVKFSKHPLKREEKYMVCNCMTKVVAEVWQAQSLPKKAVMMFWKCLK